ncbi:glycoside hydrolase family 3 C-terminal domain-containing protein [Bacteroides salyersiae]|uniref:glycoside hydrolase family 3 N-terminal domain-containing protein n=1 Tax=Bacteroides salyersiae TaxID=291644 RepID=UPI001C38C83F|nr:glycoside hydrolase family 3 N-terminal domain-containing protein [Bacteroides salyersiae]MBV4202944.1 glycoside hydrolase family 3 C-terminal domain-containing protein [Bacteroides salyersiae]MCB6647958.1 glycoside hydrolase family 3 C-terminal domain-containing protein [Bacteroides salyersiae]
MRKFFLFVSLLLAGQNSFALPVSSDEVQARSSSIYKKGWIDFNKNGKKDIYEDPTQPIEKRVEDLLSQMTIEEKSCQLATLYGFGRVLKDSLPTERWKEEVWKDGIANIDEQLNGVGRGYKRAYDLIIPFSNHVKAIYETQRWFVEQTRLGIPVDFSNEGIHGLNHTLATPLPAPVAIGCTWNRDLVNRAGHIVGKEGKALGYTNVYAPILDVVRDPRWGRTLECYGEDPFLIAELGIQMVNGIQSEGIGATLKHFAVYSIPKGGRDGHCRTDPHVSPREMHELLLYPFKRVIKETKPWGVMSSYNDWDGVPVSASYYFLTELLREEYGFDGYVVSDSEAVEFVYTKHKVADSYDDAVRQVLEAGMNVRTHFTPPNDFILPVRRLLAGNKISMSVIDQRVREVLAVKFRMGLFDNPYPVEPALADKVVGADKHPDFVNEMQRQAMVLLKNENQFLPLDKQKIKKVLVAGPLADEDNFMISRYGPNGLSTITVLEGVKGYLQNSAEVIYEKGCDVVDKGWPASELFHTPLTADEQDGIKRAVKQAETADVVIAVLGEDEFRVGESRSRTSLELPGRQQQLLEALHATGKPVVLVLINGQPLTINWADAHLPAILEAWFPSYQGGRLIAETLFGEHNPSGKLSVTFPKSVGQIELNFPFKKGSHGAQPKSGPNGSGSTRVLGTLYPFGYGLSYTTYSYANLEVEAPKQGTQGEVKVAVDVTNTGKRAGEEIVQLYIRDLVSSVVTYDSQLRGFEKVYLAPGETKRIHFILKPEALEILDRNMEWKVEPGDFEILVGASSEDIRLKKKFTLCL